jgi:hypothetical protein
VSILESTKEDFGLDALLVALEWLEEAAFSFCDSVQVDQLDGE